tara:strand:- start:2420 stop:2863 length:444 start_codon:yes stop_codon:yes gene_type:complete
MFRHCRNLPSVTFLREPGSDRIGCLTTQNLKLAFVTYTNILLRENRVFVNQSGFVDLNGAKSRDMLLDQLSFFSFSFSVPQTVLQKERFAISGKGQVTQRGCGGFFVINFLRNVTNTTAWQGGKDDLVMAFLIGLYHATDRRFQWVR